jgi:hypothetical protein
MILEEGFIRTSFLIWVAALRTYTAVLEVTKYSSMLLGFVLVRLGISLKMLKARLRVYGW